MRLPPLAPAMLLGLATSVLAAQPSRRSPPLASGRWVLGFVVSGDTLWSQIDLRVSGDSVHGVAVPPSVPTHGVVRGDSVDLTLYWDSVSVFGRFRGTIRNGRMMLKGLMSMSSRRGDAPADTAELFAYAPPVRNGPPRSHTFEPTVFHRSFSGAIAPTLRIFPGDTVRTKTVDAFGEDWNGVRRSSGGNPQTGPFYIEGALPGDVIVVHLHRVRLNRDYANAGQVVALSAITPASALAIAREVKAVSGFNSRWKLDRNRGVAMLEKPTPALANYEIPLRPMLGGIGVAPWQKQAISTQDSGPFGGNMDYNELREGVSVFLPVYEPGALLFVGDGHAAQGDGELSGNALETSMDVEFSVDVLHRQSIGTPRARSDEFLMSIGIAGDLQEALRVATSDMIRWLGSDYKLNAPELASVLGTSMRYDIADMIGTQISVVAKIPRAAIARLQKPK